MDQKKSASCGELHGQVLFLLKKRFLFASGVFQPPCLSDGCQARETPYATLRGVGEKEGSFNSQAHQATRGSGG